MREVADRGTRPLSSPGSNPRPHNPLVQGSNPCGPTNNSETHSQTLPRRASSVFKDMCGLHSNFTALQLARIGEIAREMKMILEDSKKREQEAIAKAVR